MPFFGSKKEISVAIIGTGFSGICAGIQLKRQLGIKAQIFEISPEVGGTWHVNAYPGAECDIPSHLYSFSFEQNPSWSKHYSSQREIYGYLQGVAKKHNLYEQIKFETEVVRAEWKEQQHKWLLQWRSTQDHTQTGSGYFDAVISGVGGLRIPKIPKEFKEFAGPVVHTTWWDSSIDYTNKRIAVVGSGASAVQVVPALQKIAAHVYNYQRTPAWCNDRDQFSYSRLLKFIFKWVPFVMRLYRIYMYFSHEFFFIYFKYHKQLGGFVKKAFTKSMSDRLTAAGRPDLIPVLVPDYPVGCKRITKHEHYLEALAKPNVTVIPSAVREVNGRTIVDKNGNETEVDILVLATGFHVDDMFGNLNIYGKNNVWIREHWEKNYSKTYKSIAVNGFPNFFMLLGPSSGLGHNSIVSVIEIQTNYVIKCIKHLTRKDIAAIEPKHEAQEAFVAKVQKGFDGTVWKGGCDSWYQNQNGEIYTLWHSTITAFWWELRSPNFRDFIEYRTKW